MISRLEGIIPVMLTPYLPDGAIDYDGLARLTNWYIDNGSDALFAVCQSSEMQYLSLEERVSLAGFVHRTAAGRVPVIASGHVSGDIAGQKEELAAIAQTGVDGIVLVTNRLDPENEGEAVFRRNVDALLAHLPENLPLGLYECPAPYRRLLSDSELLYCAQSGRFNILKDVSCDLATVQRRVGLVQGTPLAVVNANAAIAYDAMKSGARGFTGVFTNFHPDLYKWLLVHGSRNIGLAEELSVFLALAAMAEPMGYPKLAKMYHQRLGTFAHDGSRVVTFDVREKYWAIDVLLDKIEQGTQDFRRRIAARQ